MNRATAAIVTFAAFAAAACSGGSESSSDTSAVSTTTEVATTVATTVAPTTTALVFDDGPLDEVCGPTIVVQAGDFPHVGVGPLYALLGTGRIVDAERQSVSAPLTRTDGTVENVTIEIRSGGPAVGFRSPISVLADDESIHLAVASTAAALRDRSTLPTRAVLTLTDRSDDAVIIDPATYPDVADVADVAAQGIPVRHVTDAPVIAYLTAMGVLDPNQLEPGSDGLPASFVEAEGTIAQQGDLTLEPALLPTLPQWSRPVRALPAFAAGWASLDDMIVVDAERDRLSDECLGRFVRVLQQAIVAYVDAPAAANAVMSDVRAQFNPLSRLTPELMDNGTQLAVDAGLFDETRSDPPGAIEMAGLDDFLVDLAAALGVETVTADDLVDATYLDVTISR